MRAGLPAGAVAIPDFAHFTTQAKCEVAVRRQQLTGIYLIPEALGGGVEASNRTFVPPWIAEQKQRIDMDTILPMMRAGKLLYYQAQPIFRGSSLIPVQINLHAHDPAGFATTLDIW